MFSKQIHMDSEAYDSLNNPNVYLNALGFFLREWFYGLSLIALWETWSFFYQESSMVKSLSVLTNKTNIKTE